MVDEVGRDAGNERFEADVPLVLAGVQRAVARHDPAEVAGAVGTQQEVLPRGLVAGFDEQVLHALEGLEQFDLLAVAERGELISDLRL